MRSDAAKILVAQALRGAVFGFGSVLLGASLESRGWSGAQVGTLLTALLAGTTLASFLVGRYGDRIGRRRTYALLFLALAIAGAAFGLTDNFFVLVMVALTGTLSTEVVESGPFTSIEQAVLPGVARNDKTTRIFGTYNAIATLAGSLGALGAGGPALLREIWPGVSTDQRLFFVFIPVGVAGALLARSLSERAEEGRKPAESRPSLTRSKRRVMALSALFGLDSFAGGFVVHSFIAYWFSRRFGVSLETLGLIFFGVGILQSASFVAATRLAERVGLLNTMVFTHLPSNLLLAAIAFAPNLAVATALLLARFTLSQMDVPTRQAYVVALVAADERTAAAGYTNTARYVTRPLGPVLAGASQQLMLGLPFLIGGGLKVIYDSALWMWFRGVPLQYESDPETKSAQQSVRPEQGQ